MFKKLFPILCLTMTISGSIILLLPVLCGLAYIIFGQVEVVGLVLDHIGDYIIPIYLVALPLTVLSYGWST